MRSASVIFMPVALLFWLITWVRNKLFDVKFFKSLRFAIPTIGVGNLVVGGTGKSPHIEYLVRLLMPYINVATLSRGYGRKSVGFLEVLVKSTSKEVGDESLVLKMKYPDLGVFVGEQRAFAIPQLIGSKPETNVVLLDDIFQHRSVKPYENILLTEYQLPYSDDFLIPVGGLREWRSGAERANTIIVTKCPPYINIIEENEIIERLKPLQHQQVFFSTFVYANPYRLFAPHQRVELNAGMEVVLFSAIAGTDYLLEYLKAKTGTIHSMEFADHHFFSNQEMGTLKMAYDDLKVSNKIILTTEKDAVRLALHRDYIITENLPIFILPVEVKFIGSNAGLFDEHIKEKLMQFEI